MMLSKKKRGVDWQEASHGWAKQDKPIQYVCSLEELKQVRDWEKRPVEFKLYKTLLSENLGTHFREWPAEKKTTQKYKCLSKPTASLMTS